MTKSMDATYSSAASADQPAPGQSRYGWLAASLRARIARGEWVPGTALPAEAALAKEHGVALGTLRQALALLVAEGLLERQHGRGTFVRAGLGGAARRRFFGFREGEEGGGARESTGLGGGVQRGAGGTGDGLGLPSGG